MSSVTIVVPTFNESDNVPELLRRLDVVREVSDIDEVIFVDDSDDETASVIASSSARVRVPVRVIRRAVRAGGLSGAVVEGISAAASPWVLVMDADLQHPPEDVPRLMSAAATTDADAVVASRYCDGGDAAGLSGGLRRLASSGSTRLASLLFPLRLRRCSDSMTGFFVVRRAAIDVSVLRPRGFKILLEILVRHRVRIVEVPFTFAQRWAGESKASMRQGLRFLAQLAWLRWDLWWPTKRAREMVSFGLVGVANLVLDIGVFNALLLMLHREPLVAKLMSTGIATAASYFMNRHYTWPDRVRSGMRRELPLFMGLSAIALGVAETCLVISHYVFGLTSALADNISANVVGLGLGMMWRFWSFRRWVFTADSCTISSA